MCGAPDPATRPPTTAGMMLNLLPTTAAGSPAVVPALVRTCLGRGASHPAEIAPVTPTDHGDFLSLLPGRQWHARVYFRHLRPVDREDAAADVVAYGFTSFLRLRRRGRVPAAFARFSARAVGQGCGTRDVLAPAHRRRGFSRHCSA